MASTTILAKRTAEKQTTFDRRVHEIDLLRGLLIILVVVDHIFWNLKHYGGIWYEVSNDTNAVFRFFQDFFGWYWTSSARAVIQPLVLMAFCFISGISCAFSRNNWKRAIQTLIVWGLLAVTTNLAQLLGFFPDQGTIRIDFNIIGVLAVSTIIYCLVQNRSWKALAAGTLISFFLSWFVIPSVASNFINYFGSSEIVHAGHVQTVPNFYFPFFWEPAEMFGGSRQADYVALFPYIMFFFGGSLVAYFLYRKKKKSLFPSGDWERPICFLGRHTFLIYVGHQMVLMGIFNIINFVIQAYY
ncbi:MAG TPA: heparan-alpha-glucosaminide N-acetyltransferase domain-containing protein [Bacilli bacterium]|nr:heparan-alpha-glucosaminide N-acetyltransferase domain-containing protein [Bacilli bacterium]HPS18805.1 heparan-alpha-glucosaminide N-acetyltransferase domain-containing protein [Bacilli bacterium]